MKTGLPTGFAVLVAGALSWAAVDAGEAVSKAAASAGYALYVSKGCFACHGYLGQGSTLSGPPLAPGPMSLTALRSYVRAPKGQMPPFGAAILSDGELAQIHDYLAALPRGRTPQGIPLLAALLPDNHRVSETVTADVSQGAAVFQQHCASCHGAAGFGGAAADLRAEAVKRTPFATITLIMTPPPSMPVLYPSALSRDDVEAVTAFVRRLR